ncbi:autotransporter domain-containing protein [Neorhizobium sp. P12A]|uniref:autotransporter outer membrane beta-barrel domain-containing protein n=1 Tax=Neorhizobium sp. P12A TaxID=2268027 RepID=UPI001AEEE6D9|nr:autotransporter domain-containing protein [Neorhizobium sp. P12A]
MTRAGVTQVFSDLGYQIDADKVAVEPFVNLAYLNLDTDGFTEHGGGAALSSKGNTTDTFFTTLGTRASTAFEFGGMDTLAHGSVGWRHTLADTVPISTLAFSGGSLFDIAGVPIARDSVIVNAGLDFNVRKHATLGISYDGQFASSAIDQSVAGTFSVKF